MASTLSNPTITSQISADIASGRLSGTVLHRNSRTPSVGTSAGSVNLSYFNEFTIATGTPLSIDLTSVVDPAGNSISFGHLTDYHIENLSTVSGQDLTLGGGTNGVFTADPKPIRANGGTAQHSDPNPGITIDGTHKIFTIAAAAGTNVAGRITILGRSV